MAQSTPKCVYVACAENAGVFDVESPKLHLAKEHLEYAPHVCHVCAVASYDRAEMMGHSEAEGHYVGFGQAREASYERLLDRYCGESVENAAKRVAPPTQTVPGPRSARSKRLRPEGPSPSIAVGSPKRRRPVAPPPPTIVAVAEPPAATIAIPGEARRVPGADLQPEQGAHTGYALFTQLNKGPILAETRRRGLSGNASSKVGGEWWLALSPDERQEWKVKVVRGDKRELAPSTRGLRRSKRGQGERQESTAAADDEPTLLLDLPERDETEETGGIEEVAIAEQTQPVETETAVMKMEEVPVQLAATPDENTVEGSPNNADEGMYKEDDGEENAALSFFYPLDGSAIEQCSCGLA